MKPIITFKSKLAHLSFLISMMFVLVPLVDWLLHLILASEFTPFKSLSIAVVVTYLTYNMRYKDHNFLYYTISAISLFAAFSLCLLPAFGFTAKTITVTAINTAITIGIAILSNTLFINNPYKKLDPKNKENDKSNENTTEK